MNKTTDYTPKASHKNFLAIMECLIAAQKGKRVAWCYPTGTVIIQTDKKEQEHIDQRVKTEVARVIEEIEFEKNREKSEPNYLLRTGIQTKLDEIRKRYKIPKRKIKLFNIIDLA